MDLVRIFDPRSKQSQSTNSYVANHLMFIATISSMYCQKKFDPHLMLKQKLAISYRLVNVMGL